MLNIGLRDLNETDIELYGGTIEQNLIRVDFNQWLRNKFNYDFFGCLRRALWLHVEELITQLHMKP